MKYFLISIITFLFHQVTFGEHVKIKSKVFEEKGQDIYLEINKNTRIILLETENGWCNIGVKAFIKKIHFMGDSGLIVKGTKLYDKENGKIIGELLKDLFIYDPYGIGEPSDNFYQYVFEGYIKLDNIDETSIPERVIEKVINEILPDTIFRKEIKDFTTSLGFRTYNLFHRDSIAEYWNIDLLDGYNLQPGIRIDLIFKDNILVGIFHMRSIKINSTDNWKIEFNYLKDCCYLSTMDYIDPKIRDHLREIYKEFVYSID